MARGVTVKPGETLPPITLPATDGSVVDLAQLRGTIVVYVYPYTGRPGVPDPLGWNDIPGAHGSTPETEGFRDLAPDYARLDVGIFGLSAQSAEWQHEMAQRLRVQFPILSDAGFAFADALGLPRFETGGVTYLERLTLIARDRIIVRVFHPVPDPAGHAAEVLAALHAEPY